MIFSPQETHFQFSIPIQPVTTPKNTKYRAFSYLNISLPLTQALAARPALFSVLACDDAQGGQPVGLVNCMEGFSTFACQPLVNVHDVVVAASHRGQRVAEQMLALVAQLARARGACKLTLEVLSGNAPAQKLYRRVGFENYQLDPHMGVAQFMQKWL